MKLVNYGPGEITDRLTILSLKILVGKEKGRPTEHFERERAALLAQVASRTLNGIWFEQVLELAAVNGQLWQAEDELREWREKWRERGPDSSGLSGGPGSGYKEATAQAIVQVAFRIQALNDRRAQLVSLININSGDGSGGEEKI